MTNYVDKVLSDELKGLEETITRQTAYVSDVDRNLQVAKGRLEELKTNYKQLQEAQNLLKVIDELNF